MPNAERDTDAYYQYHQVEEDSGYAPAIGDAVMVTRAAATRENGWTNSWTPHMDGTVGNTYEVISINGSSGVSLSCGFSFPIFVLQLVTPAPQRRNGRPNAEI